MEGGASRVRVTFSDDSRVDRIACAGSPSSSRLFLRTAANLKNALLLKVSWPIELTKVLVLERYPNGKNPLITMVLTIIA